SGREAAHRSRSSKAASGDLGRGAHCRARRCSHAKHCHDLPAAWNAPNTTARTKQRLTRILIQEVVIDLDQAANEAVITVHWHGGRHTEIRVARVRNGRYPDDRHPTPVEVIRKLGG